MLLAILATLIEGVGIALFLPLLAKTEITGQVEHSIPISILLYLGVTPTFESIVMVIVGVFFLKGCIQFLAGSYQAYISAKVVYDIRSRIINLLSRADYAFVSINNSGYLANVLINEVARTFSSILAFSKQAANIIAIVVFGAIVMATSGILVAAIVVFSGIMLFLLRGLSRWTKHYSIMQTDKNGILSALFVQLFQSSKYLFSTNSFHKVEYNVQKEIQELRSIEYKPNVLVALSTALAQPLSVLFMVGVMFVQVVILKGTLAPILVLMMYLYRIMSEIMAFQNMWQTFNMSVGGVDMVYDTIQGLTRHAEKVGTHTFQSLQQDIRLRNVEFQYAEQKVLHGINLTIKPNQTVAFVGSSGAGKSTLVDVLTGLLKPTSGNVYVDSIDVADLDVYSYRSKIGYVTQDCILFDDSILNNVSMWDKSEDIQKVEQRVRQATRKAKCEEFISNMPNGYETIIGERGARLSGGQRQRIAIARELYKDPEILILDEATSALDSDSESFVQDSIRELYGEVTVVIIAHRLSTIRHADIIYVLENGRIVEEGSFDQLVGTTNSLFRGMCIQQNLIVA